MIVQNVFIYNEEAEQKYPFCGSILTPKGTEKIFIGVNQTDKDKIQFTGVVAKDIPGTSYPTIMQKIGDINYVKQKTSNGDYEIKGDITGRKLAGIETKTNDGQVIIEATLGNIPITLRTPGNYGYEFEGNVGNELLNGSTESYTKYGSPYLISMHGSIDYDGFNSIRYFTGSGLSTQLINTGVVTPLNYIVAMAGLEKKWH